ncbi:DUF4013 domain-containing protein [Methanobrevibacter sp.]|uniref:DUF4013 domain-containing protein n=1 Tax=Methanobrevibacter sp. TaxID=66852 RepID=UPI0025F4D493|nr:DUF4013 domain-containing protein [Methanobrevibacter sp.]MBQ2831624.1 DUF4013 domain-containing protein [Methanobrevibacter sp.]
MGVGDIIGDALAYPFSNIKALVLYAVLSIIAGLIGGATLVSTAVSVSSKGLAGFTFSALAIIGLIVLILVLFLIEGYGLDIVKFGIERRSDSPGIDLGRQIGNAIKLIIVSIVYYIIPAIIILILGLFLKNWILLIISIILVIIFALANFMAKCRLAKTDSLGEALAIGEAIGDISRVGLGKIIATVIVIVLVLLIAAFIIGLISKLNNTIGSVLLGIFAVYFVFFYNRAIGLLYSEA